MSHNTQKKIAVINDFSGFGRCSIAVSLPIISALGIQCCPLPTAIFSNHTGFSSYFWTDFTPHMAEYADEWRKLDLRFDAITSGFLGSLRQIELVKDFFRRFKTPDTLTVVDPVMGDNGALYKTYTPEMAAGMRELVREADILTPNLTEACLLTGIPYSPDCAALDLEAMCRTLSDLGPRQVVITGLELGDTLGNFVFQRGEAPELIQVPKVGPCRSGTGDVFAALIAGTAVLGLPFRESVRFTAAFLEQVLHATEARGVPRTDGVCFEECMGTLTDLAKPYLPL